MTRATKAPLSMRSAKPWAVVAVVAATLLAAASEGTADSLRVGRPSARGFAGVPLVTGVKHGFFRNQGLDLELAVLGGGRTSQVMTAGSVDLSVQSGTEMAFLAKGVPADIANRTYDDVIPEFLTDGKFNDKALAALSRSFVELKYLPKEPDMKALYTEEFLPKP